MANSIDININFKGDNNPEKPENENQVESKPSKAQEKLDTEALKSKPESAPKSKTASKSKAEPEQSALEKYISGKSTSSQALLAELDSSKVKISKELRTLMSKGRLYVVKGDGFRGRAYESIKEVRDHPRQNKRRMNQRVAKALESLLKERENALAQLAASTETVQAPIVEPEVAETPKAVKEPQSKKQPSYKIAGSKKAKELFAKAVDLVSKETGVDLDLSSYSISTSKKFEGDLEIRGVTGFLDNITKELKLLDVGGKNKYLGKDISEKDFLDTAVHELIHVLQNQTEAFNGDLFEELPRPFRPNEIHARRAGSYIIGKYLVEQGKLSKETFDKFHKPEHLLPETAISEYEQMYKGKEGRYSEEDGKKYEESAIESITNALEKPEPIAKEVEQAVQPVVEAKDNLFNYTQESPGQPAEPKVVAAGKKASKVIKDALVSNIDKHSKLAAEIVDKAMSGGGGKKPPKTPKAPPTGDDGEGDDGDGYGDSMEGMPDSEYDRVLKAQVENLQRSFSSKLFGEKESTFPSSLQRIFEAGRRTKDFEDIQKLIDKEVAAQTSMLKAFETSNQNTANLLEAKIKNYIDRESTIEKDSGKSIDKEKLQWLYARLEEVRSVREKTQQEYNAIEASIGTQLSESATRGFAQGKVDRDMEEIQMQQKDEDKAVKQYQREFKSFVTKKYKELANIEAFDAAKTYVQTNMGKLPKNHLDAMAKIAYDKKFEEFMASVSFESELSPEEIMIAYQEGQGTFKPEAFRPKNAPKNFYGATGTTAQQSASGGNQGTGQGGSFNFGGGSMGGGGSSGNPPIGFGPGGTPIPPSRSNISMLVPNGGIDVQAIKNFKIAEASINAIGKTLVAASTKGGVRPGQIFGQASNTASTIGLAGYAAQGAASMGLASGATGAAGAVAGPVGLIVAGVTLSASYLAEIADNTSKNVEAFSPELIMTRVNNTLQNLSNNIDIANRSGQGLANYQQSSNLLSRQLYNLGVEIFDRVGPFIQIVIDALTIVVVLLRIVGVFTTLIYKAMYGFLEPLAEYSSRIAKSMTTLLDWLLGRATKLPDFEQEFMKNDPRK